MIRPEQPTPNYRGKATQTVLTPHGNSFEMCIDDYITPLQLEKCDITDELNKASKNLNAWFYGIDSCFNDK